MAAGWSHESAITPNSNTPPMSIDSIRTRSTSIALGLLGSPIAAFPTTGSLSSFARSAFSKNPCAPVSSTKRKGPFPLMRASMVGRAASESSGRTTLPDGKTDFSGGGGGSLSISASALVVNTAKISRCLAKLIFIVLTLDKYQEYEL